MKSQATVRAARPDDAGLIHQMLVSLAGSLGASDKFHSSEADIRRHGFCDPPGFHALIAEHAGQAVGLCLYFFSFSSWMGQRGVYVQDIWVSDSERGSGLGRRLIGETARRAAGHGAAFMRLSVDSANAEAQRFYRSIGMELSENERIFKAVGERFQQLRQLD